MASPLIAIPQRSACTIAPRNPPTQPLYIKDQPSWPISVSNCIYETYNLGDCLHRIR